MDTYLIQFVLGDWSGDGHEKTNKVAFLSSHPIADINAAYENAVSLTGLDIIKDVACDYEEGIITSEQIKIVHKHCPGYFKAHTKYWTSLDGKRYHDIWEPVANRVKALNIDEEKYTDLVARWIRLGNPSIVLAEAACDELHIGGYGLFY